MKNKHNQKKLLKNKVNHKAGKNYRENKRIDIILDLIFKFRKNLVNSLANSRSKNDKRKLQFSFLHYVALRFIDEREPLMREIADFLAITPPSATSLIKTLLNQGYIERVSDKNDRRIIRISATLKGKRRLKQSRKKVALIMRQKLAKLKVNEQKRLIEILEKIIKF